MSTNYQATISILHNEFLYTDCLLFIVHVHIMDPLGPGLIIKVSWLCHLGPQLSVWIMQVSLFSSVHINSTRVPLMLNVNLRLRKVNHMFLVQPSFRN